MKEAIESIAREVLKNWLAEREKPAKLLFVFCDSKAHEAFQDQFIFLQKQGICHDLLFLDGETSSWLGMSRIECGGAGKVIASDEFAPTPLELMKDYDGLIVPEMDLDNAARVALGLKGTVKAEVIFAALALQKLVLAGEDAPGINRSDRRSLQVLALPQPYRALFERHCAALRELGIILVPQKALAETAAQRLSRARNKQSAVSGDHAEEETAIFSGRLLAADWLLSQRDIWGKSLTVSPSTIISPLAFDLLKEKKITLVKSKG
jgi:hypothetical protein